MFRLNFSHQPVTANQQEALNKGSDLKGKVFLLAKHVQPKHKLGFAMLASGAIGLAVIPLKTVLYKDRWIVWEESTARKRAESVTKLCLFRLVRIASRKSKHAPATRAYGALGAEHTTKAFVLLVSRSSAMAGDTVQPILESGTKQQRPASEALAKENSKFGFVTMVTSPTGVEPIRMNPAKFSSPQHAPIPQLHMEGLQRALSTKRKLLNSATNARLRFKSRAASMANQRDSRAVSVLTIATCKPPRNVSTPLTQVHL
jgi:hypothetical protein